MGEWALRTACLQNKEWQLMGMRPMQIAVNISARQFQRRSLPSLVRKILADTGLDPSWLDLELTESILMENPDLTGSQLARLKNMGVCLSIDDFGTGYSSLSYLQKFPVDAVKIDRSFIRDVTTNPESAAITRAIVAMADSLGLRVVAEGVETLQQVEVLRELGCREIQGYFISRPVASADFVRILKTSGEWLQAA
jgi:EAL domain-containing protein (putative c-di-GMP-specific phosphodiesterase class I)